MKKLIIIGISLVLLIVISVAAWQYFRDPIDRVVRRVSSNPYFGNGPFYEIHLPCRAPIGEVVTQAFVHAFPLPEHPGTIELLTNRDVAIHGETYTAALVRTSGGQKVILLECKGSNWWSKIYDQ